MRHGQTDWNHRRLAIGQQDIPLNALGIAQARDAQKLFKNISLSAIFHSPLRRAVQTAEIINEKTQCPLIEIDDLKECSWGIYEGKPKGTWLSAWAQGKGSADIEDCNKFSDRIIKGMNQAISRDGTVLIIAHGAVYWRLQDHLKIKQKYDLEPCALLHHEPLEKNDDWHVKILGHQAYNQDPFA